jgi:hypothetical protein
MYVFMYVFILQTHVLEFSHKEAIEHLLIKSGYKKSIDDLILSSVTVTRFKSQIMTLPVKKYLQKRKLH